MRLATILHNGEEKLSLRIDDSYVLMEHLNRAFSMDWPLDMLMLLHSGRLEELNAWFRDNGKNQILAKGVDPVSEKSARCSPLYRYPGKIWGIGLNYVAHAEDLSAKAPTGIPGSFMKPATAIIGPGDTIRVPKQSHETTAEAELGVVIGKTCKNVPQENWLDAIAGFTTIIDMTAVDILKKNTRYLTLAKSFDTFFSFGPELLTPDEVDDVMTLKVATWINSEKHAENTVSNMTFPPDFLVAFHSEAMTLEPGDIISTGTPGGVQIHQGDVIECRIQGFKTLINPVHDEKQGEAP